MVRQRWYRILASALVLSLLAQTVAPVGADWLARQAWTQFERGQGLVQEATTVLQWAQGAADAASPSAYAADMEGTPTAGPALLAPALHDPGDTNSQATEEDKCKPAQECGSEVKYDNRALVLRETLGAAGLPIIAIYDSRYETTPAVLASWIPTTQAIDSWEMRIEGWTFQGKGARPLAFWDTTDKKTGQPVPAGVYFYENTYGNYMGKGSTSHAVVVKRSEDGPLGYNWAHNFQSQLVPQGESTVILKSFGIWSVFARKSRGVYESSSPANGRVVKLADGAWQWERTGADGSGVTGVVKFDAQGRNTGFVDYLGNETKMNYDQAGRLTSVVDPVGRTTALTYDGNHIVGVTDAGGSKWTLAYQNDDLTEIVNPLGHRWRFTYDPAHRVVQKSDPKGNVTRYAYDAEGGVTTVTDAAGNTINFETKYHLEPLLADDPSQAKPDLGTTTIVYRDRDGRETSRRRYTFDDAGLITAMEFTADGGKTHSVWRYRYGQGEESGLVLALEDPAGGTVKYQYIANTKLASRIEAPGGKLFTFNYRYVQPTRGSPGAWLPTRLTQRGLTTTELAYDESGVLERVTRGELEYWLRPAGPEAGLRGLVGAVVWNWDGKGDPAAAPGAKLRRYEFDRFGQVVAAIDPMGARTTFAYDGAGRLIRVTDPLGRSSSLEYDALGRIIRQVDALGGETRFTYDANGNLSGIIDARGRTTTFSYDYKDRLVTRQDPLGRALHFGYDNEGRLLWREDARGARTTYGYDGLGRMSRVSFPTGEEWQVAYDTLGRVTRAANQSAIWSFENDEGGRVTKATLERGGRTTSLSYSYDREGRVSGMETSDGYKVSYTYGGLGQLTHIKSPLGEVSYEYATKREIAPRLTEVRFGQLTRQYSYDAAGRLTELAYRHNRWPAGKTLTYRYTYDRAGNIASLQDPAGTTSYTYDLLDRLTSVTYPGGDRVTYAYDAVGNRTKKTTATGTIDYTYDAANQLLMAGDVRYTYDADGHLIGAWRGNKGRVYAWDYQGQLRSVADRFESNLPYPLSLGAGGGDEPDVLASYTYDALGQLVGRRGGEGTRALLVDRAHVVQEYDEAGVPVVRAMQGRSWDAPTAIDGGAGSEVLAPYANAIGTIEGAIDAKGEQRLGARYDPWGAPLTEGQEGARLGFQGRPFDPETGLYQFRARFYDPALGRFISPDPFSLPTLPGAANGYVFGLNNPVRFADPSGQIIPLVAAIIIGAAFGAAFMATYQSAKYAFSTPSECFQWSEFFYRMGTGALVGGATGALAGATGFALAGLSLPAAMVAGGIAGGGISALENVGEQLIIERRDSLDTTEVVIAWGAGTIGGIAGAGASGVLGSAVGKEIGTKLIIESAQQGAVGSAAVYALTEPFASKITESIFTSIANWYRDVPTRLQSQGGGSGGGY